MNREIKMASATVLYLALASGAFTQTTQKPDAAKWMCRNLADSGNFLYEGETVFGTQACRPIPQAPPPVTQAITPAAAPAQPAPPVKHGKPILFIGTAGPQTTFTNRTLFGGSRATTVADDQTAEVAKDFSSECFGVVVTIKQDGADYIFSLTRLGNNFNRVTVARGTDGSIVLADNKEGFPGWHRGTTIKAKVTAACTAIMGDWNSKPKDAAVQSAHQGADDNK